MKVIPVASPQAVQDKSTPDSVRTAKAVAAFNKGVSSYDKSAAPQAQETPVQDPNNVSPEEMSAIKAPTQDKPTETVDNPGTVEETAPTVEETKPAKNPVVERQFAEIARQERILRAKAQKQQQELQAQKDALKAQEAAINARGKEYEQGYISKAKLKADPLAALAEAELSYDELTQQLINQQPANPRVEAHISRLEAKIRQLEEANETSQKAQAQAQQDAYKAAVKQIERDAVELVKSDPSAYEAIIKTKSVRDVVELIEKTYEKDRIVLSVEQAAKEVEDYLVEEGVSTISRIEKIKRRLTQTDKPKQTQAPQKTQPAPMKTLTNATSSTRKLSAKERAILAFEGELKS